MGKNLYRKCEVRRMEIDECNCGRRQHSRPYWTHVAFGMAKGWKPSLAECKDRSERLKGRKYSAEHRAAISAGNRGKKMSKEACEKIRLSRLGTKHTPEWCANHSAKMKGRKFTPEHKENIRKAVLGSKKSEKARANMRAAWILRKSKNVSSPSL